MTDDHRDHPGLSPKERRFIERLNAASEPQPMSAARRAALDSRLRERLRSSGDRGSRVLGGVIAAAVVAIAVVWTGLPHSRPNNARNSEAALAGVEPARPDPWERRLFYDEVSEPARDEGASEVPLPPEYAAIAVFLDG